MSYNRDTFMYKFNGELLRVKTYKDYDIKPKLIKAVFNSYVKQIESGAYHTAFLTVNGNVYGCINDIDKYTLGLPRILNKTSDIQKVISYENIVRIGCCQKTTFCLDDE